MKPIKEPMHFHAEQLLAAAMYPDHIINENEAGQVIITDPKIAGDQQHVAPKWARSWAALGPLMVEHDCYPRVTAGMVLVHNPNWDATNLDSLSFWASEDIEDFHSKDAAIRYALVKAITNKIKAERS